MPAKAGIRYAAAVVANRDAGGYWIARSSRAMTAGGVAGSDGVKILPSHSQPRCHAREGGQPVRRGGREQPRCRCLLDRPVKPGDDSGGG